MIVKLLEFRTLLLKIYQKARWFINVILKFILAWYVFKGINEAIGYDTRFTGTTITLLLCVISAILPGGAMVFFAIALSLVHIVSVSKYLAVIILLLYLILYGFMMRFSPKQALAAVAVPILAKYNLHYAVPIVLGCTANPLAALPCACGVIVYYVMNVVKLAAGREVEKTIDDIVQFFQDVVDAVITNKPMIITVAVFTLVIVVIYVLRKFSFDYAFVISIGAGTVVNIIGFLIADLKFDVSVNIGTLILMSVVSMFVALIVELYLRVLDYTAVERVQFEDDDYYYYVKAVPKVNVGIPRHDVRRISRDDSEEDADDPDMDEEGDDYYPDERDYRADTARLEPMVYDEGDETEPEDPDYTRYGLMEVDDDDVEEVPEDNPDDYEVEMDFDDSEDSDSDR